MNVADLLDGRVALVTGAGRGIGRGIALTLAGHGARVAVNDVQPDAAQAVVGEIEAAGGQGISAPGSVADPEQVDALVTRVEQTLGPINILVNNAGINRDAMLVKMTLAQWQEVLNVDLTSQFLTMRRILPGMQERGSGRVVNISSVSREGNIGQANYAAAKAGVIGLTKTASREMARYGVTVNAICPGFIDTEMTRSLPEKVRDMVISRIPLGRVGTPEDVAGAVIFLVSDYGSYVTGEVLTVGGGMTV